MLGLSLPKTKTSTASAISQLPRLGLSTWDEVFDELKQNEEALKQIRVLLRKPVLRTNMDYEAGPKALFTQLPKAKRLTYWFGTSSQLALHEGRKENALEDSVLHHTSLQSYMVTS